jgi:hypothetical protein
MDEFILPQIIWFVGKVRKKEMGGRVSFTRLES